MKVRVEYKSIIEAINHAKEVGGWIAQIDGGSVRWYSPDYTTSDIFEDCIGLKNVEMGVVDYWEKKLNMEVA